MQIATFVHIPARHFSEDFEQEIIDSLTIRYANKVMQFMQKRYFNRIFFLFLQSLRKFAIVCKKTQNKNKNQNKPAPLQVIAPNHGLGIMVSKLDDVGAPRIFQEDGGTYVKVKCRLIVFNPYINEIIQGEVAYCDKSGIRISLGFFEQVFIPFTNISAPNEYNEKQKQWIHKFNENSTHVIEITDRVYFKV